MPTTFVLRAGETRVTVAPGHGCLIAEIDPGRGNLLWTDGRQPRQLEPSGLLGEASAHEFDKHLLVGGWFPMFPTAGVPTASTQQHGWAPRVAWAILDSSGTHVTCRAYGPFLNEGIAEVTRTIRLGTDALEVNTVVSNIGEGAGLFTWGEHPCFAREMFAAGYSAFNGVRVAATPGSADGAHGHISRHGRGGLAAVVGTAVTVTLTDQARTLPHWLLWYNYAASELPRADTLAWEPSTAAGLGIGDALAAEAVECLAPGESFNVLIECTWTLSTNDQCSIR